jgi:hypothetical protein
VSSAFDAFSDIMGGGGGPALTPLDSQPPRLPVYNPIRVSTAEFGGRWGHTPAEVKRIVRTAPHCRTLEQLVGALTSGPGAISHVESIPVTSEVRGRSRELLSLLISLPLSLF